MQIAGTQCAVCWQGILVENEGLGCPHCNVAYHKSCLLADLCPNCGADLAREQVTLAKLENVKLNRLIERDSRNKAILYCVGVIIIQCFYLTMDIGSNAPPRFWMWSVLVIIVMIGIIIERLFIMKK